MQRRERCDKVSPMNANPKLWQFICAVIVLIAVQFAPVLARAHADHAHGVQAHVHVHHHAVAHHVTRADFPKAVFAEPAFTEPAFIKAAVTKSSGSVPDGFFVTASRPQGAAPVDSDGCVDGCCGAGMGCCGAAALATASQCLPSAVHSHRLDFTGALPASGIEPASLRKPPRPLA
jgi:hypothetical protein